MFFNDYFKGLHMTTSGSQRTKIKTDVPQQGAMPGHAGERGPATSIPPPGPIPDPYAQPPGRWDAWKRNKDLVKKVGGLMLIFFILWCLVVFTPFLSVTVPLMIEFMEEQPFWLAASVFGVVYLIGTAAYIPRSIFGAVMGYVWGFWAAVILEWIFATLEGMLWAVAAGDWLRNCIKPSLMVNPTLRAIDRAIEDEGFETVLLLRLVPIGSFPMSNALIATSKAPFWQAKVGGTFIGVLPFSFLYAIIGVGASDVGNLLEEALGGGDSAEEATLRLILLGVGVLATLVLVFLIGFKAKKQLGAAMDRSRAKIEEEERAKYQAVASIDTQTTRTDASGSFSVVTKD